MDLGDKVLGTLFENTPFTTWIVHVEKDLSLQAVK